VAYLLPTDYKKIIQSENLQQVIGSDTSIQTAAELTGIAEAKSYLVQRYDTLQEFSAILPWNYASAYSAKSRVVIDYVTYSASSTYSLNSRVVYQGSGYICTTAITAPEAWNASHWTLLGSQYAIFNAALPYSEFNYSNTYAPGDIVWWKNKTYTCKTGTLGNSHEMDLQQLYSQNQPLPNVAPDDLKNGFAYWGAGTLYTVPANTLLTNTTYWTAADSRDQQVLTYVIDIVLYHLHSRIAPRNIPDLRIKRYDDAVKWFKMAAKGEVTPALPLLQPTQGGRIRFGGQVKNINTY
jgi:Protein of unknown function (DUF1320)